MNHNDLDLLISQIADNNAHTHIAIKNRLKHISSVEDFRQMLNGVMLSDADKQMLEMIYIKGNDFRYIADSLGFSESTIKRRHKQAIAKLNNML